jgi:hypothetical protein
MSTPERGTFEDRSLQGFKLVKQASDNYRRVATRLERARKALQHAEADFDDARRGLKLAIDAVQPSLPAVDSGPAVPGL